MRRARAPAIPRPEAQGFTLLELVIVLALTALLTVLLGNGLRFGLRVADRRVAQEQRWGDLDPVQGALRELIARGREIGGGPDRLELVARLPGAADDGLPHDLVLATSGDGRLLLSHRPHRRGRTVEEPRAELTLAEGVAGLDVAFYAGPERQSLREARPIGWSSTWRAIGGVQPYLVRLRLQLPPGDRRLWPDLVIQPRITGTGPG